MTRARNMHARRLASIIAAGLPLPPEASAEDHTVLRVIRACEAVAYERTGPSEYRWTLEYIMVARDLIREAGEFLEESLAALPRVARRKGSTPFPDDSLCLLGGISVRLSQGLRP